MTSHASADDQGVHCHPMECAASDEQSYQWQQQPIGGVTCMAQGPEESQQDSFDHGVSGKPFEPLRNEQFTPSSPETQDSWRSNEGSDDGISLGSWSSGVLRPEYPESDDFEAHDADAAGQASASAHRDESCSLYATNCKEQVQNQPYEQGADCYGMWNTNNQFVYYHYCLSAGYASAYMQPYQWLQQPFGGDTPVASEIQWPEQWWQDSFDQGVADQPESPNNDDFEVIDADVEGQVTRLFAVHDDPRSPYLLPKKGYISIGQAPENIVVVADSEVSAQHCLIYCQPGQFDGGVLAWVEDHSRSGTAVNGMKLLRGEWAMLHHDDVISLSATVEFRLEFCDGKDVLPPRPPPPPPPSPFLSSECPSPAPKSPSALEPHGENSVPPPPPFPPPPKSPSPVAPAPFESGSLSDGTIACVSSSCFNENDSPPPPPKPAPPPLAKLKYGSSSDGLIDCASSFGCSENDARPPSFPPPPPPAPLSQAPRQVASICDLHPEDIDEMTGMTGHLSASWDSDGTPSPAAAPQSQDLSQPCNIWDDEAWPSLPVSPQKKSEVSRKAVGNKANPNIPASPAPAKGSVQNDEAWPPLSMQPQKKPDVRRKAVGDKATSNIPAPTAPAEEDSQWTVGDFHVISAWCSAEVWGDEVALNVQEADLVTIDHVDWQGWARAVIPEGKSAWLPYAVLRRIVYVAKACFKGGPDGYLKLIPGEEVVVYVRQNSDMRLWCYGAVLKTATNIVERVGWFPSEAIDLETVQRLLD